MKIKTHLRVLKDILFEIVQVVGTSWRSLFISEASREKQDRSRFLKILEITGGAWSDSLHPELKISKNVESYVREKRHQYRKRLKRTGQ